MNYKWARFIFVNDIIATPSDDNASEKKMINLFKVEDNQNNNEVYVYSELHEITDQLLLNLNIKEGNFVYKVKEKERLLELANTDSVLGENFLEITYVGVI